MIKNIVKTNIDSIIYDKVKNVSYKVIGIHEDDATRCLTADVKEDGTVTKTIKAFKEEGFTIPYDVASTSTSKATEWEIGHADFTSVVINVNDYCALKGCGSKRYKITDIDRPHNDFRYEDDYSQYWVDMNQIINTFATKESDSHVDDAMPQIDSFVYDEEGEVCSKIIGVHKDFPEDFLSIATSEDVERYNVYSAEEFKQKGFTLKKGTKKNSKLVYWTDEGTGGKILSVGNYCTISGFGTERFSIKEIYAKKCSLLVVDDEGKEFSFRMFSVSGTFKTDGKEKAKKKKKVDTIKTLVLPSLGQYCYDRVDDECLRVVGVNAVLPKLFLTIATEKDRVENYAIMSAESAESADYVLDDSVCDDALVLWEIKSGERALLFDIGDECKLEGLEQHTYKIIKVDRDACTVTLQEGSEPAFSADMFDITEMLEKQKRIIHHDDDRIVPRIGDVVYDKKRKCLHDIVGVDRLDNTIYFCSTAENEPRERDHYDTVDDVCEHYDAEFLESILPSDMVEEWGENYNTDKKGMGVILRAGLFVTLEGTEKRYKIHHIVNNKEVSVVLEDGSQHIIGMNEIMNSYNTDGIHLLNDEADERLAGKLQEKVNQVNEKKKKPLLLQIKHDVGSAVYRIASKQAIKALRTAILASLQANGTFSKRSEVQVIERLLKSRFGESLLAQAAGQTIQHLPKKFRSSVTDGLSEELRVEGWAICGEEAVEIMTESLMKMWDKKAKPGKRIAQPEVKTDVVYDIPDLLEEEMVEDVLLERNVR